MSLQFIMGGSGSGKSTYLYHMISRQAAEHRQQNYIVLVPDQFTLETQKTLVHMSGKGGILNVDVLSFHRLAYRVFEQVPVLRRTVLEDVGKMMLLRKVLSEQRKNLKYFKHGLYKPGFLDECKSFLCELVQYAISDEEFEQMQTAMTGESLTELKLQDLHLIYRSLREKMGEVYMMAEELVVQLTSVASSIPMLRDSVICLDGFTGFTPTQYELLGELMRICDRMVVTVTTDRTQKRSSLFSMSSETIEKLTNLARAVSVPVEEPVVTGIGKEHIPYRLKDSKQLCFMEKNIFSYRPEKWRDSVSDLRFRVCRKESDEAAFVAREISRLVRQKKYRYDEIAVVTGDVASYEGALSREMSRMNIRYFMDYKKNIGANAMAEYIMSFLAMYRKNMDYESTFRFLRCGLSPLTKEETDILENYVLARGKRGFRSYQSEWEYEVKRIDLVAVNEYRRKFLNSVRNAFERLRGGKKTVREFSEILYHLIADNHLYERLREQSRIFEESGEIILAHEYRRIYRLMMELLDELVELLGSEEVSFREYEELIGAGISEGLVGFVPPTSNQVVVGDVERSRLGDIKVLFFLGVSDDRIPRGKGGGGLLSESEREKIAACGIELAPLPEKQSEQEQFYMYLTLTKPSDRLYMSYSRMGDDGSSKRPAYLFQKVHSLFPLAQVTDDEKETSIDKILGTDRGKSYFVAHLSDGSFRQDMCWWELAAHYRRENPDLLKKLIRARQDGKENSRLSEEAAKLLYGDAIYGSVSRLETFARCPYAHYIIYGLGLLEREQFQIQTLDYGNIFHKSMEHFSHRMEEEGKNWKELTEDEALKLAEDSVSYAVREYKGDMFFQSHRAAFAINRIRRIMNRAVWGIWRQMREGNFEQLNSEESFSAKFPLGKDRKMILGGVIDRLDICRMEQEMWVKIVDYKSSSHQLSLDRVFYGLQLQLLTYMQAALSHQNAAKENAVPAAMLYYEIKEPQLPWKNESEGQREEREMSEFRCSGYVNEMPEILGELDSNLAGDGQLRGGVRSRIIPVATNKGGDSFLRGSCVMSTEQFEELMAHTNEKIREFGDRIYDGEIAAAPYRLGDMYGCEYCGLSGVCGMEMKQLSGRARKLEPMKEDEVWEVLHGKYSVDSGSEEDH